MINLPPNTNDESDSEEVTLDCGNWSFVPAIEKLTKRMFRVEVVFWDNAATELKNCCTRFVSLNAQLKLLAL